MSVRPPPRGNNPTLELVFGSALGPEVSGPIRPFVARTPGEAAERASVRPTISS